VDSKKSLGDFSTGLEKLLSQIVSETKQSVQKVYGSCNDQDSCRLDIERTRNKLLAKPNKRMFIRTEAAGSHRTIFWRQSRTKY